MYFFDTKLRVRYAETDQMGYVYYGNYGQYYEVARVESLRAIELPYNLMEERGIMMPVLALTCNYYKPAYYDDLLTIRTTVAEMPEVRMQFNYEIFNEKNILINKGSTLHVFVDSNTRKPCKIPDWIKEKLLPYF